MTHVQKFLDKLLISNQFLKIVQNHFGQFKNDENLFRTTVLNERFLAERPCPLYYPTKNSLLTRGLNPQPFSQSTLPYH